MEGKKNSRILVSVLVVALISLSCSVTQTDRSKARETVEIVEKDKKTETQDNQKTDKSETDEKNVEITLIPVNPGIPVRFGTLDIYNAKAIIRKGEIHTKNDITENTSQSNTHTIDRETHTENTVETKHTFKIAIPWYVYFFVGLFSLLAIIILFILIRIFQYIKIPST